MSNINSGKFRETTATGYTKHDCWLDLQKDSKCFQNISIKRQSSVCVCVCVSSHLRLFRAGYQLLSPSCLLLLLCIAVAALTLLLWYHSWQELLKRQQSKGLQERSSSEGGEQGMEMLTDIINWHPHAVDTTRYRAPSFSLRGRQMKCVGMLKLIRILYFQAASSSSRVEVRFHYL